MRLVDQVIEVGAALAPASPTGIVDGADSVRGRQALRVAADDGGRTARGGYFFTA